MPFPQWSAPGLVSLQALQEQGRQGLERRKIDQAARTAAADRASRESMAAGQIAASQIGMVVSLIARQQEQEFRLKGALDNQYLSKYGGTFDEIAGEADKMFAPDVYPDRGQRIRMYTNQLDAHSQEAAMQQKIKLANLYADAGEQRELKRLGNGLTVARTSPDIPEQDRAYYIARANKAILNLQMGIADRVGQQGMGGAGRPPSEGKLWEAVDPLPPGKELQNTQTGDRKAAPTKAEQKSGSSRKPNEGLFDTQEKVDDYLIRAGIADLDQIIKAHEVSPSYNSAVGVDYEAILPQVWKLKDARRKVIEGVKQETAAMRMAADRQAQASWNQANRNAQSQKRMGIVNSRLPMDMPGVHLPQELGGPPEINVESAMPAPPQPMGERPAPAAPPPQSLNIRLEDLSPSQLLKIGQLRKQKRMGGPAGQAAQDAFNLLGLSESNEAAPPQTREQLMRDIRLLPQGPNAF